MTIRKIVTPPNPTLRSNAQKVRTFGPGLQTLIDDMIETMRAAPGVGLAAPQVDVSQRIIVVEYADPPEDPDAPPKTPKLYSVVNPEIVRTSKETVFGEEACLSLPGFIGDVERHEWVTVKGQDRHGNDFKLKPKGFLARIFQHEIDHLNGVLFIDHATEIWRVEEMETAGDPPAA
jgi:peptide deformylase